MADLPEWHNIRYTRCRIPKLTDVIPSPLGCHSERSRGILKPLNTPKYGHPITEDDFNQSLQIYAALKQIIAKYRLDGLTLRCFDLLTALGNTGCLSLSLLNAEGFIATCEGDIPAMLTMAISRALTGVSGFQANPSRIDVEKGEMLFAHCTIPLDMIDDYDLDTHFESGIGIGVRGRMRPGDVTVFKVSGDLTRVFAEEGVLVRNQAEPDLCRTQQVIRLDNPVKARYFLTCPIGNHHVILPGRWKSQIEELLGA